MELNQIHDLLTRINGCTFASLDAETQPIKGFRKIVRNQRVILFTNAQSSGYENVIRRRLIAEGKDPNSFVVGDLPWGERVQGTPLIMHEGRAYLQTILLHEGEARYYIGHHEITEKDFLSMSSSYRHTNQGLSDDREVRVLTYLVDNITEIRLLGETRPVLSIRT